MFTSVPIGTQLIPLARLPPPNAEITAYPSANELGILAPYLDYVSQAYRFSTYQNAISQLVLYQPGANTSDSYKLATILQAASVVMALHVFLMGASCISL